MIYYDGILEIDKVHFLNFKNDKNQSVSIPMDKRVIDQIMSYLQKLQPTEPSPVERGNDESSEVG